MVSKVLIAVGGTGGHLFPAQALARQLLSQQEAVELVFAGAGLRDNLFFDREAFAFEEVPSGLLSSRNPIRAAKGVGAILRGVAKGCRLMRSYRPNMVVGFGSFHCFPVLMAAKLFRIPMVLYEANSIPGRVNRLLAPFVKAVGVSFPEAKSHLRGHVFEVSYPLREGFSRPDVDPQQARAYFGLAPEVFTLLVFGGSQGAQGINSLFSLSAKALSNLRKGDFQILHLTGPTKPGESLKAVYESLGLRCCVKPFEKEMGLAWKAADLMVSRSGAGAIAEQIEMEVPGLLIPYPHAMDNHQHHNAVFMCDQVGGAVMSSEASLDSGGLEAILGPLMNDEARLRKMRENIGRFKREGKSEKFSALVCRMGGVGRHE